MSGRHGGDGETAGWLRGQLAEAIGRLRRAEGECDRLRVELEEARQHIKAQSEVDRILALGLPAAANGDTGPIARIPGQAAHRVPREHRWLKVVPGFVPVVLALKASLAAHPATAIVGGTTAAVALAAAVAVVPGTARAHEHPPGVLAPNPAASAYSATPIMVPSSPAKFAAAFTRPRLDARSSASQPAAVAPWCCYAPPPSSSPAVSPQPSVPSSPSSPVSGIIQAVSSAVTVTDPAQDVQIPISATGGDTVWHAWVRGPGAADVTLTPAQGDLADGTAGYIDLAIDAGAQATGGSVTVHVWPGDVKVVVTWLAVPVPVPSVVPTDAVTGVPTDTPSPAAS